LARPEIAGRVAWHCLAGLTVDRLDSQRQEAAVKAAVGDRIILKGRVVGNADRTGKILEVHGADGAPPYLVHWDDGHQSLVTPGGDTVIEHLPQDETKAPAG